MSFTAQEKQAYDNRMADLALDRRRNMQEYFGISQDTLREFFPRYTLPVSGLELREARQFNQLITYVRNAEPKEPNGKGRTNIPPVRHAIDFRNHGPGRDHISDSRNEKPHTKRPVESEYRAITEGLTELEAPQRPRHSIANVLRFVSEERILSILRDMKPTYSAAPGQLNLEHRALAEEHESIDVKFEEIVEGEDVIGPQYVSPAAAMLFRAAPRRRRTSTMSHLDVRDVGVLEQTIIEVPDDGRVATFGGMLTVNPEGHFYEHAIEQQSK